MKRIELSRGKYALVDDADFDSLNQHKWHFNRTSRTDPNYGIAMRWSRRPDGKRLGIIMHRELLPCPEGHEVDHIDGNSLNNQRHNLRIVTRAQNTHNTRPNKGSYKGAKWHKGKKMWEATIRCGGRNQYLGNFSSGEEAALAYDAAAIQVFGDYAYLNLVGKA